MKNPIYPNEKKRLINNCPELSSGHNARRLGMKKIILVLLAICLTFTASIGYASSNQNCISKGSRGVANITFAFFELFQGMDDVWTEYGPFASYTYGIAQGLAKMALRTMVGVYEATTFLIPPYGPILKDPVFFDMPDKDEQYPVTSSITYIFKECD